jgi:hypothetical protein
VLDAHGARRDMPRLDHLGVVVDDLDAVGAFSLALGFEREGGALPDTVS